MKKKRLSKEDDTIALLNMDVVGQMECLKDWQMKN